jgi:hypothetical protein
MARTVRDYQRWVRPRHRTILAKTAARGYGGPHTTARTTAVKAFRPGQPCAIGGEPLWQHTHLKWCDLLDLAHNHQHGGYLGLSCRKHNRGHYDRMPQTTLPVSTGRRW